MFGHKSEGRGGHSHCPGAVPSRYCCIHLLGLSVVICRCPCPFRGRKGIMSFSLYTAGWTTASSGGWASGEEASFRFPSGMLTFAVSFSFRSFFFLSFFSFFFLSESDVSTSSGEETDLSGSVVCWGVGRCTFEAKVSLVQSFLSCPMSPHR